MRISKYEIEISRNDKLVYTATSKGNQPKYYKNGYWYKLDFLGYEGLAEVICSRFAKAINYPYDIVEYNPCIIITEYGDKVGCSSYNFCNSNNLEIAIPKLLKSNYNIDVVNELSKLSSTKERIKYVVDKVSNLNGLKDYGKYLTSMLEFDRLVLNEDRHLNNLTVFYKPVSLEYCYAPLFDNGASLLSDTKEDYPLGIRLSDAVKIIKSKPFNKNFDKQVNVCEELFGKQLVLPDTINVEVSDLVNYYNISEINRCKAIIDRQLRFYYSASTLIFKGI